MYVGTLLTYGGSSPGRERECEGGWGRGGGRRAAAAAVVVVGMGAVPA